MNIERQHMPLCPYCASTIRAGRPYEIVTMFGLMALAHGRCAAALSRTPDLLIEKNEVALNAPGKDGGSGLHAPGAERVRSGNAT